MKVSVLCTLASLFSILANQLFIVTAQAQAQAASNPSAAPSPLPGAVEFQYSSYTVPADFPYVYFNVERVGNVNGPVIVLFSSVDGTGKAGIDYQSSSGSLVWQSGQSAAQQIQVPLIPRRTGPYGNTFSVVLHDPIGVGLIVPSIAIVTVTDPSPWNLWGPQSSSGTTTSTTTSPATNPITLTSPPSFIGISNNGTAFLIPLTLPNAAPSTLGTVNPDSVNTITPGQTSSSSSGPTAPPTPPSPGTISGLSSPGTPFTIPNSNSNGNQMTIEPLSAPTSTSTTSSSTPIPATSNIPSVPTGTTLPTSLLDGTTGTVDSSSILTQFASAFSFQNFTYNTDNSQNFVAVAVQRVKVLPTSLLNCSVDFTTVDSSAVAGVDYWSLSGTLFFGANDFDPRIILITLIKGSVLSSVQSGFKSFSIKLSNPVNSFLGVPSSTVVSIQDLPFSQGEIVLSNNYYTSAVETQAMTISVDRLLASSGTVTVNYATSDGSAIAGIDYVNTTGSLQWTNGDTAPKTFIIPLIDTTMSKANALPGNGNASLSVTPQFFISLTQPSPTSGGFIGQPGTALCFITNNASIPHRAPSGSEANSNNNTINGQGIVPITTTAPPSTLPPLTSATGTTTPTLPISPTPTIPPTDPVTVPHQSTTSNATQVSPGEITQQPSSASSLYSSLYSSSMSIIFASIFSVVLINIL